MTLRGLIEAVEAGTGNGKWGPLCADAGLNDYSVEVMRAFNGSLDAAKALHDALLPGWAWTIQENGENTLWPPNDMADQEWCAQGYECVAPDGCNPARAWLLAILRCLAILRALEADQRKNEG